MQELRNIILEALCQEIWWSKNGKRHLFAFPSVPVKPHNWHDLQQFRLELIKCKYTLYKFSELKHPTWYSKFNSKRDWRVQHYFHTKISFCHAFCLIDSQIKRGAEYMIFTVIFKFHMFSLQIETLKRFKFFCWLGPTFGNVKRRNWITNSRSLLSQKLLKRLM